MHGLGWSLEIVRTAILRRQLLLICAGSLFGFMNFSSDCLSDELTALASPLRVSIPEFHGSALDRTLAKTLTQCVRDRLQGKLALQFIETSYLAGESPHKVPEFDRLEVQKVRFLIVGSATFSKAATFGTRSKPDTNHVEFRLWDVVGRKHLFGRMYFEPSKDWPQTCQSIADEIYRRLVPEKL